VEEMKYGVLRMALSRISGRFLLLCEGMHDAEFFKHLGMDRGFQGTFQIASCGYVSQPHGRRDGIGHLTAALDALPSIPDFHKLEAIIVAADNDSDARISFQNVQNLINATAEIEPGRRYSCPPAELTKGGANPTIVIMMVPWTGIPGALDTLCHASASARRPAIAAAVARFAAAAGVNDANGWPITKQHKMHLRSLLSAAYVSDPYIAPAWVWGDGTDLVPLSDHSFNQIAEFLGNFSAFIATP
jgi:hypothetical protein